MSSLASPKTKSTLSPKLIELVTSFSLNLMRKTHLILIMQRSVIVTFLRKDFLRHANRHNCGRLICIMLFHIKPTRLSSRHSIAAHIAQFSLSQSSQKPQLELLKFSSVIESHNYNFLFELKLHFRLCFVCRHMAVDCFTRLD